MKLRTFRNMKGLIYGDDPMRIQCDTEGVLKIGTTEVEVTTDGGSILPLLHYGGTGRFAATFTDRDGNAYELDPVTVREGRIEAPPKIQVELEELRYRADRAEEECEALRAKVYELEHIFDTDSLNFLIK